MDRGAVATELVLLVPAFVLVIGLLSAGARIWFVRANLDQAAEAGARAASIARTRTEADRAAAGAIEGSLAASDVRCSPLRWSVNSSALSVAVGRQGTMLTKISCGLPLSDLSLPGLPPRLTLTGSGSALVDSYRGRG